MKADSLSRSISTWVLSQLPSSFVPPPDVQALVGAVGATVECSARPGIEGETLWIDERPVIRVPFDAPEPGRQTFTLAHEVAHVAVAKVAETDARASQIHRRGGQWLERLCDDVAAETLLPRNWVDSNVDEHVTLKDVQRVAAMSRLSWMAAAVRLFNCDRDLVMIRWLPVDGVWKVVSAVGVQRRYWADMVLSGVERDQPRRVRAVLRSRDFEARFTWEHHQSGDTLTTFVGSRLTRPLNRFVARSHREPT